MTSYGRLQPPKASLYAGALDLTSNPTAATRFNRSRLQGLSSEVDFLKTQLQERSHYVEAVQLELTAAQKDRASLLASSKAQEGQVRLQPELASSRYSAWYKCASWCQYRVTSDARCVIVPSAIHSSIGRGWCSD